MTADSLQGRMLWYELLTSDVKAAETFYGAVLGWTFAPFAGATHPYDVITRPGDVAIGGVMRLPEGVPFPPHWEMYVGVDHLDESIAGIERLGGSSLSPIIEIPNVGRLRTMRDPQGAVFAILQPSSSERSPELEAAEGEVAWHELYTTDAAGAMHFYRDVFGWRETSTHDMGPSGQYYMFGRRFPLGGMMTKTPDMAQLPTHWNLYFRVAEINAGAERVTANGGQVVHGPMEVPGGDWIVQCMDPQGAAFSLHQVKA